MEKLLYISPLGREDQASGLSKKIDMQVNFFERNNIKVILTNIKRPSSPFYKIWTRLPFTGIYEWSKETNNDLLKDINYIYIRYHSSDYQLIRFLKKVKKLNKEIKIFIEIPTYPYGDENQSKLKRGIHINKDIKNRQKLKFFVDRIVTFSKDEYIFDIPTIRISNVVDFNSIDMKENKSADNELNLIAVGSLYFWHGYDRVIEGLKEYYRDEKYSCNVNLHLVGGGPELSAYRELVKQYRLEEHIFLYGPLKGKELDEVYDKADIGLDSMGRHRSGVFYNSSLKGKEYGAKGLPIVSGVETELDLFPEYDFYKRVPANDNPIDINDIIAFYKEISEKHPKETISKKIRDFNKQYFHIDNTWDKIINAFRNS